METLVQYIGLIIMTFVVDRALHSKALLLLQSWQFLPFHFHSWKKQPHQNSFCQTGWQIIHFYRPTNRGGYIRANPGLDRVPNSPHGLCGRKATLHLKAGEIRISAWHQELYCKMPHWFSFEFKNRVLFCKWRIARPDVLSTVKCVAFLVFALPATSARASICLKSPFKSRVDLQISCWPSDLELTFKSRVALQISCWPSNLVLSSNLVLTFKISCWPSNSPW